MVLTSAGRVLASGNIAHVNMFRAEEPRLETIRGLCLNIVEKVKGESFHLPDRIRQSTLGSVLLLGELYLDQELTSSLIPSSGSLVTTQDVSNNAPTYALLHTPPPGNLLHPPLHPQLADSRHSISIPSRLDKSLAPVPMPARETLSRRS